MEDHTLIPSSDPSPSTPMPPPHPSASPSKSTPIRTPASNSTDKNHASETTIQSSTMEVDTSLSKNSKQWSDEEEQDKISLMEEGPESEDLVGLDLLKLEAACRQKYFSEIPPRDIEKLEGVLIREQQNKYLRIQEGSPFDGKFFLKDTKK